MVDYKFSADWFSVHIPQFERYVAPLNGTPCRLLEIGVDEGRATTWLADNVLSHPASALDCIDLTICDNLRNNVDVSTRRSQITLHEGLSRDVLKTLEPASYDFIYVDGSHSTVDVLEDAVLSFRLAKIGATIAFDDYLWDDEPWNGYGAPKQALDAFMSIYADSPRYEPLLKRLTADSNDQIWVTKLAESRNCYVEHSSDRAPPSRRAARQWWSRFRQR